MLTKTVPLCDTCGAPATHAWKPSEQRPSPSPAHACESCACRVGSDHYGEACLALQMIGLAVKTLRNANLSERDIRRAFEDVLADKDESIVTYSPIPGEDVLLPDDGAPPWSRMFGPLSAVDTGDQEGGQ